MTGRWRLSDGSLTPSNLTLIDRFMPRRPALKFPQPIGDILERVMKREKLPFRREDNHLCSLWRQVVGETIAQNTRPLRMERGVLHVCVASSVWLQELRFLKEEILERFNGVSRLVPLEDIRFVQGEVKKENPPGVGKDPLPFKVKDLLTPRDHRIMTESLQVLSDPELKEIIRRVMEKEIVRRRFRERKKGRK